MTPVQTVQALVDALEGSHPLTQAQDLARHDALAAGRALLAQMQAACQQPQVYKAGELHFDSDVCLASQVLHRAQPAEPRASHGATEDATDAAKWRALLSCGRVRPLGSAGCERDDERNPDYAHIGFELWTHCQLTPEQVAIAEEARALGRKWLERFVEKAMRVAAATHQPAPAAATTHD